MADRATASPRGALGRGHGWLRILMAALGMGATAMPGWAARLPAPYADRDLSLIYNLLFCDELELFRPGEWNQPSVQATSWQRLLFDPRPDAQAIRALAMDAGAESRVRALAYHWLRRHALAVPRGEVLGIVVEVPLAGGLDVLAAYRDGRVRYLNHGNRMVIMEDTPPEIGRRVQLLLESSQLAVDHRPVDYLRPRRERRPPPPGAERVRISFLVSDGLYSGEGPFVDMQRDPMAGPILLEAGELARLASAAMAPSQRLGQTPARFP